MQQLLADLAFAICVLFGYDPCDHVRARPEWMRAAQTFAASQRIDGWTDVCWWRRDDAEFRPSVVRDVWIEAFDMPDADALRPFAFQANGAWEEIAWARGAIAYVREMAELYPHVASHAEWRLAYLQRYHDAFNALYVVQPDTQLSTYSRRWHLQLLRDAIGDEAFRNGVMPGRIQP